MRQGHGYESHLREAQQVEIHGEATRGAALRLLARRCDSRHGVASPGSALRLAARRCVSRRGVASPGLALRLPARMRIRRSAARCAERLRRGKVCGARRGKVRTGKVSARGCARVRRGEVCVISTRSRDPESSKTAAEISRAEMCEGA
jgi:hypothetical protein